MKKIASLKDHMIICGGGLIGKRVAYFFREKGIPFVLIEKDEDILRHALLNLDTEYLHKKFGRYHDITKAVDIREEERQSVEELAGRLDIPYLQADPTDDSSLLNAGIHQARGLVAVLDRDRDNLFVVVSARALANELENEALTIVSLVVDDKNGHKLKIAGADRLVMPEVISGYKVADFLIHPQLGEFMDHMMFKNKTHHMWEIHLNKRPELVGQTVYEIHKSRGMLVAAIKRDGVFHYTPSLDETLAKDDILIVMGPKE